MKLFKVAISTVGCRANQADSGYLASHLSSGRVAVVQEFEDADMIIINTCCVTGEAERDCRKLARRAMRAAPEARVVLVGCAVNALETFGQDLDPRVVLYKGEAAEPGGLAAWINDLAGAPDPADAPADGDLSAGLLGRTRGLLKIQTGCTHHCAYCIVPKARGKERSMPRDAVLREVGRFADAGVRELVLTGVQIGAWGKDIGGQSLADLLRDAADRIAPGRIRLSSIEPWSVDEALLAAMASHPRICPHLHLPLQNGDDSILTSMRRGYDVETFVRIVQQARAVMPDLALGTDVILGFPGEDDRAFENTKAALIEIAPAYLHAFTYSPRPGTRAAGAARAVDRAVAQARTRIVRRMGAAFARDHRASHVGSRREVIVEDASADSARGLTDTFVKVLLPGGGAPAGALVSAAFAQVRGDALLGALPQDAQQSLLFERFSG